MTSNYVKHVTSQPNYGAFYHRIAPTTNSKRSNSLPHLVATGLDVLAESGASYIKNYNKNGNTRNAECAYACLNVWIPSHKLLGFNKIKYPAPGKS